jgi:hypothetical protein
MSPRAFKHSGHGPYPESIEAPRITWHLHLPAFKFDQFAPYVVAAAPVMRQSGNLVLVLSFCV